MLEKALAAAGEARMVVIEDPERPVQDGELSALLEAAAGAHAAVPAIIRTPALGGSQAPSIDPSFFV